MFVYRETKKIQLKKLIRMFDELGLSLSSSRMNNKLFSTSLSFCRHYGLSFRHHRSQTCRSHVYYPSMCAFEVTVHVRDMLRAPGADSLIEVGSSSSGKF